MSSQPIRNVNISFEICTNMCKCVRGTLEEPRGSSGEGSGAVRGRFGEGSGKVRGRFGEGSGKVRGSHGGATARTPCGHFYGTLIILVLEPCRELAIKDKC